MEEKEEGDDDEGKEEKEEERWAFRRKARSGQISRRSGRTFERWWVLRETRV